MSEYTDIKKNTYEVTQTVIPSDKEKEEMENEIVEALYRIFTQK